MCDCFRLVNSAKIGDTFSVSMFQDTIDDVTTNARDWFIDTHE